MSDRPRVGVSACLLGERVRYDGGHKRDAWLVDVLGPRIEWVPVCPEVEAGLGTPREPIRLERAGATGTVLMTVETRRDLTQTLRRYSIERVEELAELDGYVLKADSPSCGPAAVPIFSAASPGRDVRETGRGVFAAALIARFPDMAVADERQLADAAAREQFVDRVFASFRGRERRADQSELSSVAVVRVRGTERIVDVDCAAVEEPLEIRLHGRPFAVIMRTPGADRELAAGFLLAERVIRHADDLGTIEHCVDANGRAVSNVVNVSLAGVATERLDRLLADRRNVQTSSSCGLCGRRTIESLAADVPSITTPTTVSAAVVRSLPQRLRAAQAIFDETGGLHAAGLFTPDGRVVDVAEDVGRHNAVDKIVGRMLMRERLPLSDYLLFVSGRTSFEIVQKALFAGLPVLAAVSAPSSLAIDLAARCGITLVGFVRGDSFNIYAHGHRVIG